jgi:hypothetical protein
MTPFQIAALTVLSLLLLWEMVRLWRRRGFQWFWLLRTLGWVGAGVAIARPDLVQDVAIVLGIGRGADVVLYLSTLTLLSALFYFYSRHLALQRQITMLVRHLALQEVRRGKDHDVTSPGTGA